MKAHDVEELRGRASRALAERIITNLDTPMPKEMSPQEFGRVVRDKRAAMAQAGSMGLERDWRHHVAASPVTRWVAESEMTEGLYGVDLTTFATQVVAELNIIHEQIAVLCAAIDEMNSRN